MYFNYLWLSINFTLTISNSVELSVFSIMVHILVARASFEAKHLVP